MDNPVMYDPPPSTDDLFPADPNPLAIPPLDLDHALFTSDLSFSDNFLSSDADPDFNLDDIDINFDDVLFDSIDQLPCVHSDQLWYPDSEGFNFNPGLTDPRVSDLENAHLDADSTGPVSSHDSHDGGCDFVKASNCPSLGSELDAKSGHPSPGSGSCDHIGSGLSSPPSPGEKCNNIKRKKEHQVEGRIRKVRRSEFENVSASFEVGDENEEVDKKKARLIRNRESALLSRQRKKQYVEELEDKVRTMQSAIAELNTKVSYVMAENLTLKQQLSGGGMFPPHRMYPMAPMNYPWMPYPPYALKQGSQVPLVPIPRLKVQRPVLAPKVGKKPEKMDKKKSETKTKKLASVSFLGLLFFMLLFGGLVPIVHVRYGGVGGNFSGVDRVSDMHRGRTLMIDDGGKCYSDGRCGDEHGHYQEKHFGKIPLEDERMVGLNKGSNGSVVLGNSSEPLAASLYVPKNDKLVRIDGNLIIHSVLASEKAGGVSRTTEHMKTSEETRLAIARNYIPTSYGAGAVPINGRSTDLNRDQTGKPMALGSSATGDLKNTVPDGMLQHWLLGDLAGPVLSSGICTEVFRFEVTPSPGSVVPATSMANIASEYMQNSTRLKKSSRKILREHSIPLKGHTYNLTKDKHVRHNAEEVGLQGNKSSSSIVVSVLVDPREATDVDSEGMFRPKSLSRIFVVVLIDSVKYVTYSCMLPMMGSSPPHLVTA